MFICYLLGMVETALVAILLDLAVEVIRSVRRRFFGGGL